MLEGEMRLSKMEIKKLARLQKCHYPLRKLYLQIKPAHMNLIEIRQNTTMCYVDN